MTYRYIGRARILGGHAERVRRVLPPRCAFVPLSGTTMARLIIVWILIASSGATH